MKNTPIIFAIFIATTAFAQNRIGTGEIDKLYQTYCAACHGEDLRGGEGESLIDDVWKYGSTDEDLTRVISEGILENGMIPYKGVLTPEQIRALVIYIREQGQLAKKQQVEESLKPQDGVFQSEDHQFTLEKVLDGNGIIWAIDFLPNGSFLFTERQGDLYLFENGKKQKVDGIPAIWQRGQGGLLEVAVHPDYQENGWIYLGYSETVGATENGNQAGMTAIVRGRISDGQWVDQEDIFHVPGEFHTSAGAHFGTRFVFQDGYLFFSIGDRGRQQMAQDLSKPNGKHHRIHDDGRVPESNPFIGVQDAYPTIWTYGNRNPQGLDQHPITKQIWSTEHGPRGGDELNIIEGGKNYGWPTITYGMNYNGTPITDKTHQEGMEQPVKYWTPSIAVCGIEFYEGDLFPAWKHNLFVSGMASQELHRIELKDGEVISDEIVLKNQGRIRDIANGPEGSLYLSLNGGSPRKGSIYRLVPVEK